jgi:hypothetical protein
LRPFGPQSDDRRSARSNPDDILGQGMAQTGTQVSGGGMDQCRS